MSQNLSAQFVCPSPKVPDFNEKRLHWASVVRGEMYSLRNCHQIAYVVISKGPEIEIALVILFNCTKGTNQRLVLILDYFFLVLSFSLLPAVAEAKLDKGQ